MEKCVLNENTKSLIIGDSHTYVAINDKKLNNIQNVSWNAEGYIYTYAKLRHILNNEPKVSEIFLGLSYHNFSGYYDNYIYGDLAKYFSHRYIGVLSFEEYFEIGSNASLFNIYGISRDAIKKGIKAIATKDCAIYGSFPEKPLEVIYNIKHMETRIKYQYYNKTEVVDTSAINIRYLNKIVDLCKERNIKLIMFQTPMHKDYISRVPKKYVQYFHHFIQRNNLHLFDFSGLELPDSCYLDDGDHVNYYGAVLTTNAFKEYIEERNNE